jgi:hypothetical protein
MYCSCYSNTEVLQSVPAVGQVRVEVGNRITQWMTQLPSGEIRDGEPEHDPLGFSSFGVGDGGSDRWKGVAGRSVIERSIVPLVRGSTAGDPFPSYSVAWVLLGAATVKGVAPSGGPASCPRSTCDLGM